MNYFIDFDHTLYDTPKLSSDMLKAISSTIAKNKNLDNDLLFTECKNMFNRENIYNIYKLAKYFSDKYNCELDEINKNLNNVIYNAQKYVFEDSIPFLQKLRGKNHKLYMISYCEFGLEFQTEKIVHSKLIEYFDSIITTSIPKYNLDIDYKNGIFIDDKPKDIENLYLKDPIDIIRIRRPGDTYSNQNLKIPSIKEYQSLLDIPLN